MSTLTKETAAKIEAYARGADRVFTVEDVRKDLNWPQENATGLDALRDFLDDCPYVFQQTLPDGMEGYYPRAARFNGMLFKVKPSAMELKEGILFPGHRFLPFYPMDIFPSELKVRLPNGRAARTKMVRKDVKALFDYHWMLGVDDIIEYFIADHRDNERLTRMETPTGEVKLKVLDLADSYRELGVHEGDSLLFEVSNWAKGQMSLKGRAPKAAEDDIDAWIEDLEDAALEICDAYGPWLTLCEQLARAFFRRGGKGDGDPAISVEEFMRMTDRLSARYYGGNLVLWRADAAIEENDAVGEAAQVAISRGKIDSLEEILSDIGADLCPIELEARIRRELAEGDDKTTRLAAITRGDALNFKDDAQRVIFENLVDELWESLEAEDTTPNQVADALRGEALDTLDAVYRLSDFLRSHSAKILGWQEEWAAARRRALDVKDILDALNREGGSLDADDVERLAEELRRQERDIAMFSRRIRECLENG